MRELSDDECYNMSAKIMAGYPVGTLGMYMQLVRAGYAAGYRAAQAVTDGPAADPLPVAWATPSLLVTMSAVEKRRLTSPEMRGRGGEWEADARDADRYSVPLYRAAALDRLRAERDELRAMLQGANHQNGVQRHEASAGCALGASSLESGNAREATCLNGDHDARQPVAYTAGTVRDHAGSTPATPTDPIADLCTRLRDEASQYTDHSDLWGEAADALERLALERDEARRDVEQHYIRNKALRAERDDWKRLAENWTACADAAQQPPEFYEKYNEGTMRAMQALLTRERTEGAALRTERDALREVVRAADAMRAREHAHDGKTRGCVACSVIAAYDERRAKWKDNT